MAESIVAAPSTTLHLDVDEEGIVAWLHPVPETGPFQYAFYLHSGGKRIETRWYSPASSARFTVKPNPAASYRAQAFIRDEVGAAPQIVASPATTFERPSRLARSLDSVPVRRVEAGAIGSKLQDANPTRLEVTLPGMPFRYECLLLPKPSEYLFVILGGAVPDRRKVRLPRFNRFTWAHVFPGSVLCVSDPTLTLDRDIRLGWYFGNAAADAMEGLADVVLGVAESLGVKTSRIVAYGSSGGGFAAMQLAARVGAGATAVAINAQTDLLRFSQQESVDRFLAVCADGMARDAARAALGDRLLLSKAWRKPSAARARCLLVQNRCDPHHLDEHLTPFATEFNLPIPGTSADGRMGTLMYEFPNGHAAEPRSLVTDIVNAALALRLPGPMDETP